MTVERAKPRTRDDRRLSRAHADVSRQTVSNVLNTPHRVRAETRERVHARRSTSSATGPTSPPGQLRTSAPAPIGVAHQPARRRRLEHASWTASSHADRRPRRQRDAHLVLFAAAERRPAEPALPRTSGQQPGRRVRPHRHPPRRPPPRVAARSTASRSPPSAGLWDDPGRHPWVDVDGAAGTAAAVQHLLGGRLRPGSASWAGRPGPASATTGAPDGWARRPSAGGDRPEWQASAPQDSAWPRRPSHRVVDATGPGGAVACATDTLALGAWTGLRERGADAGARLRRRRLRRQPTWPRPPGLTSVAPAADEVAEQVLGHPRRRPSPAGPMPVEGRIHRPALITRGARPVHPALGGPDLAPRGHRTDNGGPSMTSRHARRSSVALALGRRRNAGAHRRAAVAAEGSAARAPATQKAGPAEPQDPDRLAPATPRPTPSRPPPRWAKKSGNTVDGHPGPGHRPAARPGASPAAPRRTCSTSTPRASPTTPGGQPLPLRRPGQGRRTTSTRRCAPPSPTTASSTAPRRTSPRSPWRSTPTCGRRPA